MDGGSWHCTGTSDQAHPQEKEMQTGKMVALQIAEKSREAEGKGEKQTYTRLNAKFQRIQREIRKPSSVISAKQ